MENNSTISNNFAGAGGGVYLSSTYCTIKSDDKTGAVAGNTAWASSEAGVDANQSGGGIHVGDVTGDNKCTIDGLAIKDNYSRYDAGGIELDQSYTTVKNCTITGNHSDYDGGGIYVNGGHNTIENCSIRNNYCNGLGKNYEGGGVFVGYRYNIGLSGNCIVKDNTRGKDSGNADDLFLSTAKGGIGKAYMTGSLDADSSVGVRAVVDLGREIGSDLKVASKGSLFSDESGCIVRYWSENNTIDLERSDKPAAWYTVSVNGQGWASREENKPARISAPGNDVDKVFWYWDDKGSTGLGSIEDYMSGSKKYNPILSFTMPSCDVSLKVVMADTMKSAELIVAAPEAGKALSSTGQLIRAGGGVGAQAVRTGVCWYEVAENGTKTPATGLAKSGTTYVARIVAESQQVAGAFYNPGITANDVTVSAYTGKEKTSESKATKVTVDRSTGTLSAETGEFKTAGEKPASTETGKIKVRLKGEKPLGSSAATVAALEDIAETGDKGLDEEIEVTYDKNSGTVTIAAPYREDYYFISWDVHDSYINVDDKSIVEIPVSALTDNFEIVARYAPVVTDLELDLDAPVVGEEFASRCADIKGSCSIDGTSADFAEAFYTTDGYKVTWSPASSDGKADYSMPYTAFIELGDAAGFENIDDVLADDAVVTCNGVKATSAMFTIDENNKLCLAVTFPATADEEEADDPDKDDDQKDDDQKDDDQKDDDQKDDDQKDDSGKSDDKKDDGQNSGKSDDKKDDGQNSGNQNSGNQGSGNQGNGGQNSGNRGNGGQNSGNQNNSGNKANASQASAKSKKGVPATGDAASVAAPAALLALGAASLAAAAWRRRTQR